MDLVKFNADCVAIAEELGKAMRAQAAAVSFAYMRSLKRTRDDLVAPHD